MKEAFEKLKERLEEASFVDYDEHYTDNGERLVTIRDALSIVSEVEAEYGRKGCALCYLGSPCEYQNEDVRIPDELMGWIPCNEKDHPYDGQRVLACINTRIATHEIIITDYNGEIYWFDGTISAWMPLPSPYTPTTD